MPEVKFSYMTLNFFMWIAFHVSGSHTWGSVQGVSSAVFGELEGIPHTNFAGFREESGCNVTVYKGMGMCREHLQEKTGFDIGDWTDLWSFGTNMI